MRLPGLFENLAQKSELLVLPLEWCDSGGRSVHWPIGTLRNWGPLVIWESMSSAPQYLPTARDPQRPEPNHGSRDASSAKGARPRRGVGRPTRSAAIASLADLGGSPRRSPRSEARPSDCQGPSVQDGGRSVTTVAGTSRPGAGMPSIAAHRTGRWPTRPARPHGDRSTTIAAGVLPRPVVERSPISIGDRLRFGFFCRGFAPLGTLPEAAARTTGFSFGGW